MPPELHLLGGAALLRADGQLVSGAAAQPRRLAVLAVLADAWPAPVTRDRLVGLIWPDQDEQGARRLLTQALYALKRELGDFTRGSGRDIALDPDALAVDLVAFRRAIAAGDPHRAAALYRGAVLEGVHVRGAVEFERWVETLRDSTRRQFQAAVEEIARECAADGEWRDAARWRERLVRESPFDVPAVLALIDAWLVAGDRGAALAAATAYERRMREELEVEPDPAIRMRAREALHLSAADIAGTMPPQAAQSAVAPPASSDDARDDAAPLASVEDREAGAAPAAVARQEGDTTIARPRRRRMSRMMLLALPAVAGAVALAALEARERPGIPAVKSVAVLPFDLTGGPADSSLAPLVTDVLRSSLGGAGGGAAPPVGGDPAATAILRGQVVAAGALVRVDAELVPAGEGTDEPVRASVTGPRDSVIALAGRVSRRLLPSLYPPGIRERLDPLDVDHFALTSALRRFLDGEASLRHGDFAAAHEEFVAVTETAPDAALGWYRRAVAAELAHRNDDVDPSIAAALARDSTLPRGHRDRVRAYAAWRSGDAPGAERTYRQLLAANPADRDAWGQLAELQYHSGPLHGHRLDRSRDSWDRLVALDSGDVSALIHAARLHARAGDRAGVEALLRRAAREGATGAAIAEAHVVAELARGDAAGAAAAAHILDTIPEYSLHYLQGVVAGLLERPEAAIPIARRMTTADRPATMQAQGHLALAYLAIASGRWRDAMAALDSAAVHNPVAAGWTRAYFVSLPFVRPTAAATARVADELRALPSLGTPAPLYLQIGVATPDAALIQPYLESLIRQRSGGRGAPGGSPDCRAVTAAALRHLCRDLEIGLAAEAARLDGRQPDALRALESLDLGVSYQYAGRSQFFARSRERFLRASLLEAVGRGTEAEAWYAAVPHGAWTDYVFLAPSYLGRARLLERSGDAAGAAAAYAKVVSLWARPDAELAHVVREARAGLARTRRR